MLTVRPPDPARLDRFVAAESVREATSPAGLMASSVLPGRWFVDDEAAIVGVGPAAWAAARAALEAWEELDLGWFRVHRPDHVPLRTGQVVGCSARALGLWWTYCCRIVSVIDETDPDGTRRFGFTYGTIGSHAERGEERFLVILDAATGEVNGAIRAISRPARWFTLLGLAFARRAQRQFKPEALAALAGAVRRRLAVSP